MTIEKLGDKLPKYERVRFNCYGCGTTFSCGVIEDRVRVKEDYSSTDQRDNGRWAEFTCPECKKNCSGTEFFYSKLYEG
jgi:hypothetical protein